MPTLRIHDDTMAMPQTITKPLIQLTISRVCTNRLYHIQRPRANFDRYIYRGAIEHAGSVLLMHIIRMRSARVR